VTERDLRGYGPEPPHVVWPGEARVALCFVVNYEEGAEHAHGDGPQGSERYGVGYDFPRDVRNLRIESEYEYGSRVGVWRLFDLFERFDVPVTVHAAAVAVERNPAVGAAIRELGHEPCAHGWRWEEQWQLSEAEERRRIELAVGSLEATCGRRPVGWYSRYGPSARTRELVVEAGGFLYDADAYNDDLPYFVRHAGREHLVLPYSGVYNDGRLVSSSGSLSDPEGFLGLLRRAIDYLWQEGARRPATMTVGLHPRLAGHAARCSVLAEFIEHCRGLGGVWFARREDVARAWIEQFGAGAAPPAKEEHGD
jgi:peptidoglycan/xylan/chitin deacetylase (PgdA/CDA1 family)